METLKIKKLDPDAKVPERATSGSAGLDLCALLKEPLTLSSGDTAVIPTGLAIEIPSSEYAAFTFGKTRHRAPQFRRRYRQRLPR